MDNLLPEEVASSLGNQNLKQDLASIVAKLGLTLRGVFVPGQNTAVKQDEVYIYGLKWWRATKDFTANAAPSGGNWALLYNGQQLTDQELAYVRALLSPIMVTTSDSQRIGFNTANELATYLAAVPQYTVSAIELHEVAYSDTVSALDLRYISIDGKGFTLNISGGLVQINQEAQFLTLNGFSPCELSGRFFRVTCHQPSRVPAGTVLELRYCEFDSNVVVSTGAILRLFPGTQINLASVTLEGTGKVEDLRGTSTGTPGTDYTDAQARAANEPRFEQNEAILEDHEERITQLEQATPTASVLPFGPFLATGDPAQQFGPLPLAAQSLRGVMVLDAELPDDDPDKVQPIFSTMYTLSGDGLYFTMKAGFALDVNDLIEGLCSGVASTGGGTTPTKPPAPTNPDVDDANDTFTYYPGGYTASLTAPSAPNAPAVDDTNNTLTYIPGS